MPCESLCDEKATSNKGPLSPLEGVDFVTSNENKSFMADADQLLQQISTPKVIDLTFVVDDILFCLHTVPTGSSGIKLILWCTLGYLPYSVASVEKRAALIQILEGIHGMSIVRFGVDEHMKIIARADFKMETKTPPASDYFFPPLIQFLQEARPFIRLIGEYL